MALRFQTRLSLAMSAIIALAIGAMGIVVVWASATMIVEQFHRVNVMVTKLATRNIGYGTELPDKVMDRVGDQMVVSALLLSELVAVSERDAKLPPEKISALLKDVVHRSAVVNGHPLVEDLWVTDETGKVYLGAEPSTGFQFSTEPKAQPEFLPLLQPDAKPVVQGFRARETGGERFKYAGVGGVDKPRIVQVGVGEQFVEGINKEFSVQNIVDRFFVDLDVTRMLVVDADGKVIAAAGRGTIAKANVNDPEVIRFCTTFLSDANSLFHIEMFGWEPGVVTRLPGLAGEPAQALFIQHRTQTGIRLIKSTFYYVLGVSLVTLVAAVLVILLLSRGFSRPIRELVEGVREFGRGNLAHRVETSSHDELARLAVAFNVMADSLQQRMRELEHETKRRERLESELEIAAEMQRALLPECAPEMPGLEFSGWSQPAREVGGDFYDYLPLGPTRIGITIGDATGKGLSAAMLITECRSVLRALCGQSDSPAHLLQQTNAAMCNQVGRSGRFVTLFFMVIDIERETIEYAQAGHNPPLMLNANGDTLTTLVSDVGLPLGIDHHCEYETRTLPLRPGDTFILYSDGVTEARREDDVLYGEERLMHLFQHVIREPVDAILGAVRKDVETHFGGADVSDDITVVTMRFNGRPAHDSAQ